MKKRGKHAKHVVKKVEVNGGGEEPTVEERLRAQGLPVVKGVKYLKGGKYKGVRGLFQVMQNVGRGLRAQKKEMDRVEAERRG